MPSISPKPIAGPKFDPGDVHLRLAPNQKCKGPFSLHKRPLSRCPRLAQPVSHVPPTSLSLASVACRQFSARFYRFRCPTPDVLAEDGPLSLERALHIAIQICSGIGEAHHQGVIHRDVKPENVILVSRGGDDDFVKVVDFGIARFLSGESTATKAGLVFGTARYISPEAAEGLPTDTRSDVYSIGTLAYQLLCGETPFESPSPVALLMQHVHEEPPDLRDRSRGDLVPDSIADVIMQAIEKDPDARFASAIRNGRGTYARGS